MFIIFFYEFDYNVDYLYMTYRRVKFCKIFFLLNASSINSYMINLSIDMVWYSRRD